MVHYYKDRDEHNLRLGKDPIPDIEYLRETRIRNGDELVGKVTLMAKGIGCQDIGHLDETGHVKM